MMETKVEITEYCDYFSHWYGLPDGTLLRTDNLNGKFWVKVDGRTMTVEEFNNLDS